MIRPPIVFREADRAGQGPTRVYAKSATVILELDCDDSGMKRRDQVFEAARVANLFTHSCLSL